jgi:hypothetical protein
MSHIWTDSRNRLHMGRAAKLGFVYFNQRVMRRLEATPTADDWVTMLDEMEDVGDVVVDGEQEASDGEEVG